MTVHGFEAVAWRLETTFPGRCAAAFLDSRGVDRAMTVAAQAFTALIPLLLLAAVFAPGPTRTWSPSPSSTGSG